MSNTKPSPEADRAPTADKETIVKTWKVTIKYPDGRVEELSVEAPTDNAALHAAGRTHPEIYPHSNPQSDKIKMWVEKQ